MSRVIQYAGMWVRRLSLAHKIVLVTMGVTCTALLLACVALVAYDRTSARTSLARDLGILADVVGATSTAAVSFDDAAGATETLRAVRVNHNVRLAAIFHDGNVLARFDRAPGAATALRRSQITPEQLRAPRTTFTFDRDALRLVRPIQFNGELIGGVYLESDLEGLHDRLRHLLIIIAVVVCGALAVAFGLSSTLHRLISGPVLRLTAVTEIVSRDKNYAIRAEPANQDEVGVLIERFNEMLAEIERRDHALRDQQGALEREVTVRTTDLRTTNAALLTARDTAMDASRAKSAFLANMSHEIRTPMNGIMGMTDLALGLPLTIEHRQCLDTIKASATSLLALLNDILDFSKIESHRLDLETIPFSMRQVVEDVLTPLALAADQKGLELVADIGSTVPVGLIGDPGRMGQILTNLVGNAIKFTASGHVVVRVACEEPIGDRACVHVAIRDTGIGIPPHQQAVIFDAFSQADGSVTRRFGGTGLGLTISSTLVQLMGGRLWVDSEPGQGSTFQFIVTCPTADLPAPTDDEAFVDLPVLIVDDLAANRDVIERLLLAWRMKPFAVESGAAALTALREASRGGTPFALVLLDARMPDLDGFAVAERMAASADLRCATVMMLASSGQFGDAHRCRALGIAAHLTKPLRQADVFSACRQALTPRARLPKGARRPAAVTAPIGAVHVLLAEDNVVNQRVAVGLLTRRGHIVDVVSDGHEAIVALGARTYDVVLMDIQMPEMGGIEATAAIREHEAATGRHTHIVALTAHAMTGDRERYLALGMDDYLSKPIDPRLLFAAVERGQPNADMRPDGPVAPNQVPLAGASTHGVGTAGYRQDLVAVADEGHAAPAGALQTPGVRQARTATRRGVVGRTADVVDAGRDTDKPL